MDQRGKITLLKISEGEWGSRAMMGDMEQWRDQFRGTVVQGVEMTVLQESDIRDGEMEICSRGGFAEKEELRIWGRKFWVLMEEL